MGGCSFYDWIIAFYELIVNIISKGHSFECPFLMQETEGCSEIGKKKATSK